MSFLTIYTVASGATLLALVLVRFIVSSWLHAQNLRPAPKGCRRIGLLSQSNLTDEFSPQYDASSSLSEKSSAPIIKALFIYPIKGCKALELTSSNITHTGLEYDRQFTFAQLKSPFPVALNATKEEKSAHRWEMINQKQFARMVLIETQVWVPDKEAPGYNPDSDEIKGGGILRLSFPYELEEGIPGFIQSVKNTFGLPKPLFSFDVPLNPSPEYIKSHNLKNEEVFIWGDMPQVVDLSGFVPPELKYFIGVRNPMALFRILPGAERHLKRSVPDPAALEQGKATTAFADMHPVHMAALASVHDVNTRVVEKIPKLSVMRFRSNIVISGTNKAWEEDTWKLIQIEGQEMHVCCRTPRCTVPNIEPTTGVRHTVEPNKTLRGYRAIDEGAGDLACVGMQVVPTKTTGKVKIGDRITVLETGEHRFGA